MIRLGTWNVNSLRMRLPQLLRWLELSQADAVCLQELKLADDQFPAREIEAAGWTHLAWDGEPTYNGVAIVSRHPLTDVRKGLDPALDRGQKRTIAATLLGLRVIGVYVVNGKAVGSEAFAWKLQWLDRLRARFVEEGGPAAPLLLCGDYNVAPDDLDVWDPFECEGHLLFHAEERARFQALLDAGLVDPFRAKHPFANDFTWWDYQKMGFQRNHGLRIDHTLLTPPLMARCRSVKVWREARAWDQPSDHAPVTVDLDWPG